MDIAELLVYFLATWRVASLFVNEDGPFQVFRRIRIAAGIIHDETGQPYIFPETFSGGLLSCVWCFSVWTGLFWSALWMLTPAWAFVLALPFALSAGAVILQGFVTSYRE